MNLKSRLIIIAHCAGRRFKAATVLTPRDVELVAKVNCYQVLVLIWRRNVPMIIICCNNVADWQNCFAILVQYYLLNGDIICS